MIRANGAERNVPVDHRRRLTSEYGAAGGATRLTAMLAARRLIVMPDEGGRRIITDREYDLHLAILCELQRRAAAPLPPPPAGLLDACIAKLDFPLGIEQKIAIEGMLRNRVSIVHGGAGVGKSTTVQVAGQVLRTLYPAGRAVVASFSARIAVATGRRSALEGKTLHSLTGTAPGSNISHGLSLDPRLTAIFVDEAFSVDPGMVLRILRQTHWDTRIAFIGCPGQMLPIGDGRSLHDALHCRLAPNFMLETEHRLGGGSHLSQQIKRIEAGKVPVVGPGLRIHRTTGDPDAVRAKAMFAAKLVNSSIRRGITCVALTATRYGDSGHVAINRLVTGSAQPCPGNEVITIAPDVNGAWRNGERAVVQSLSDGTMVLAFDDGRLASTARSNPQIALGHAISGHRAQGLEYQRAVVVLDKTGAKMLSRQFLSSILTRAPDCVIITDPGLLEAGCARDELRSRPATLRSIASAQKVKRY